MIAALVLAGTLLAQYPPEAPPVQPTVPVPVLFLILDVPPAPLDLPSAAPGTPIRQLLLCPRNVFTSQADCATQARNAQTAANNVYAADPANPTRLVIVPIYLAGYSTTNDTSHELSQIQQNTLPSVDVHGLRDTYTCDRVTLINHDGRLCGQAFMSASLYGKAWAFSVINKDCWVSNSSLWHELGHNDGLCHDTDNSSGCTPAKPYGYGICDTVAVVQSPMTYPSPCGKPRRIFSNKDNTWTYGHPYGDATHDEAAVQRWGMPIEAAFTAEPDPNRPTNH